MKILPVGPRKAYSDLRLPSVDRTLDVLELLAGSTGGCTLSELSRKLRIPKSTAHYLVYTLLSRGYLQRDMNGRHYCLGLRVSEIAGASSAELQLKRVCSPYVQEIAGKLNLTAMAAVLRGAEAVIIAGVESPEDVGGGSWVGRHLDLHCTSQGKALVAYFSDEELDKLLGGRDLAQFTPKTISSLAVFKTHLGEVRANGFAVNDEEHVLGIRAIAAPIMDRTGKVVASVSVRGSTRQIAAWRFRRLCEELMSVTREISRQLSDPIPLGA